MYTEYHNYNSCSPGSGRNPRPVSEKAIAALILGVISILFSPIPFVGIILACIGIICALSSRLTYVSRDTLQKYKAPMETTAKIGFVFSIVGIVLGIIVPFIFVFFSFQAFNESDFFQEELPYIEETPDTEPYQTLPYEEIPEEEPYDMPDNIPYDFPYEAPYGYEEPYDFPYGYEEPAPREYEDPGLQLL